jgi:hypothetical protein
MVRSESVHELEKEMETARVGDAVEEDDAEP